MEDVGVARITGEESHRHVDSPMSEAVDKKFESPARIWEEEQPEGNNTKETSERADDGRETEIPRRGLLLWAPELCARRVPGDHLLGEGKHRFLCTTLGRH